MTTKHDNGASTREQYRWCTSDQLKHSKTIPREMVGANVYDALNALHLKELVRHAAAVAQANSAKAARKSDSGATFMKLQTHLFRTFPL